MLKIKLPTLLICSLLVLTPILSWSQAITTPSSSNISTAQQINDTAITAKVKAALLIDKEVKGLDVSVTTQGGVVTLSGTVDNLMQKQRAVELARHVEGVSMVRDELIVRNTIQQ